VIALKYKYTLLIVAVFIAGLIFINPPDSFSWKKESNISVFNKIWPWIEVVTDVERPDYFHAQWSAFGVKPIAVPIASNEKERVISILIEELNKYPQELLKKDLKEIMLGTSLTIYNIEYGATNIDNRIYITSRGKLSGYSDKYLRKTLHHELSSILIRNNIFPFDAWKDLLPKTSKSEGNLIREVKAIKKGWVENNYTSSDLDDGFVSRYGRSSIENDINTYAENLMTGKVWLVKQAKKHSVIKKKLLIIDEFYRGLGITE